MVRFVDGKPEKKGYQHFNIKTVEGPNDFASMKEIVWRRYRRILDESAKLPDLIVVDGGKGQLSSACEALKELNIYGQVPIIGIAKKLEEIYYPEDPFPFTLTKNPRAYCCCNKFGMKRIGLPSHSTAKSEAKVN